MRVEKQWEMDLPRTLGTYLAVGWDPGSEIENLHGDQGATRGEKRPHKCVLPPVCPRGPRGIFVLIDPYLIPAIPRLIQPWS